MVWIWGCLTVARSTAIFQPVKVIKCCASCNSKLGVTFEARISSMKCFAFCRNIFWGIRSWNCRWEPLLTIHHFNNKSWTMIVRRWRNNYAVARVILSVRSIQSRSFGKTWVLIVLNALSIPLLRRYQPKTNYIEWCIATFLLLIASEPVAFEVVGLVRIKYLWSSGSRASKSPKLPGIPSKCKDLSKSLKSSESESSESSESSCVFVSSIPSSACLESRLYRELWACIYWGDISLKRIVWNGAAFRLLIASDATAFEAAGMPRIKFVLRITNFKITNLTGLEFPEVLIPELLKRRTFHQIAVIRD